MQEISLSRNYLRSGKSGCAPRLSWTLADAARTITEGLRQEAGVQLRVKGISPGFVQTNLVSSMSDPTIQHQIRAKMDELAIPPVSIARAIAFAIAQPAEVAVNEIVVRLTAQG